ncbi:hypothetical protein IJK16_01820, partial [Candidatus Saccharibacteria bacterium]|nr:hypothetical protein [Candidatus Saccharibacteria bacterium]
MLKIDSSASGKSCAGDTLYSNITITYLRTCFITLYYIISIFYHCLDTTNSNIHTNGYKLYVNGTLLK